MTCNPTNAGTEHLQSAIARLNGFADSSSYLKTRTALTFYQTQDKQLAIQKRKGTLVDRAQAEALVLRLARQERDMARQQSGVDVPDAGADRHADLYPAPEPAG